MKTAIPPEWTRYLTESLDGLEVVPWCLYDTRILDPDETRELLFFVNMWDTEGNHRGPYWTSQYIAGMLPNPQSFLIQQVKIYGITGEYLCRFTLNIGAKRVIDRPAIHAAIRPGLLLGDSLMIHPLQAYMAKLEWHMKPIARRARKIQVALIGHLARPVQ
jgi:hypothetical protein